MGYGVGIISYVVNIYTERLLNKFNLSYIINDSAVVFHTQVPVYIAEITPKNLRGAFTTVNQVI